MFSARCVLGENAAGVPSVEKCGAIIRLSQGSGISLTRSLSLTHTLLCGQHAFGEYDDFWIISNIPAGELHGDVR